ncbi:MAG TPA: 23S rRNA (pseudouridine(1915)-N(3))-methyltransferase RlmH [Fermentimonas caenicola]|jgi:23S rRNA (pseudouridine1915-N3)-methyltransferase|uniref:23S rRNA (pseudouridine(1915)-N(3))-methyltransferase RlmH n=1 Tax=Lascolabacillus TaxID=1924067 RepID=UPI0006B3A3AA|nr:MULTISPECIES: 23S rRNA (pseudouridine(1915)-N(3))-methyltransferase RlmH [Lascolabacillus]MDD2607610.1 23S rRNA (pseudouridine(1915)-N(3))-methyltransferase RlmH [Lascolabacillus sp.]MDI9625068.1 23S rRNA (pseudouridine(1915)-N(3))-methyltransferase RlmH [Bacteroidota bacterium]TAH60221.1 MAG: 23S rRNA (pseudouridine(1915)-N(3))-methyltransferase RlmH [Fermentimonas caenicola]HHU41691.1 23S rRNA (pseudouridine(1915)-N(3))-methyltransferase RlmH [Fermentimonas caenicola]
MKIALLSIGKTDNRLFKEIIDEYVKRLNYYIPFEDIYIPDIKNRKSISEVEQKNLEGDKLIKALELTDYIVLLDDKGKKFNSSGFANYIEKKMYTVPKRLVFIIGGPYGFSKSVYNIANEKISLSEMTFTHQMVRMIFTEQLYRAMTIINNEPYHHE